MTPLRIDLNADLGESQKALDLERDKELMRYITSANVACGGHAGDEKIVRETLRFAKSLGVAVGAHPSYPDRENFGRVQMKIEPEALERSLTGQMRWLFEIAGEIGVRVTYLKPHGALYHAAGRHRGTAAVIARAVRAMDSKLVVVAQAGSAALAWYGELGLACAGEAFADRAYEADGSLRDRRMPGALLQPDRAAEQALEIALRRHVKTFDGGTLPVETETICIHSDTPGAPGIAALIRKAFAEKNIEVRTFTDHAEPRSGERS